MKMRILAVLVLALSLVLALMRAVTAQAAEISVPDRAMLSGSCNPLVVGASSEITFTPVATIYIAAVFHNQVGCSEVPTLVSPADGSNLDTLAPLLQWDSGDDPNATTLHLEVARDTAFTEDVSSFSSSYRTTGMHEFRFGWNFDPATTYYWRAWLTCGETDCACSDVWSFTTGSGGAILPAPALVAPATGSALSSLPVTLQWSPMGGAVEYRVFWRYVGQGGYTARWVTGTQTEISNLDASTTYEWWVAARNDYAIGDASSPWQFTTPAGASSTSLPGLDRRFVIEDEETATVFEE
jgi:hypothetical protein